METAVIGAGAAGLTAAYRLACKGTKVTVFEKSEADLGGLAAAVPLGSTYIDKYYHHIFTGDNDIFALIKELGLADSLIWTKSKNGLFMDGRIHPFTNPTDLILFPEISFVSRLRMGLTVLNAKNVKEWREMEDIRAKDWIVKKAGAEVYHKLWKPLLYSKFGEYADDVSAVWIWNKFKLRGSTRKNLGAEQLGYLRGSFLSLYKRLACRVKQRRNPFNDQFKRHGAGKQQENQIYFDSGELSSDGRLLLIKEFFAKLGVERLIRQVFKTKDKAKRREHKDDENLLQMLYQIIASYFTDDNADELK